MINYKDEEVLRGMLAVGWHPLLIDLYAWLLEDDIGSIVITCAHESRDYESVHDVDPLRGLDIRSWVFSDPQKVEEYINSNWIYDPERIEMMVAKYHNSGRGAHIHVQVHDNTIKNGLIGA